MRIFLNSDYAMHDASGEMHHGKLVDCFENPSRLDNIISAFKANGVSEFSQTEDFGMQAILAVHDADYVEFLQSIHRKWQAAGNSGDVIPYIWPVPGLKRSAHQNLNAQVGRYAFSSDSPIMQGTWQATYSGVQTALSCLKAVQQQGHKAAFSLSRPPGHHAHKANYGGYCFLNNAAICAQAALDNGAAKVCVLDVDFHHGNGTQDIFYQRSDVFTVSIHGDPADNFPYFLGFADESGESAGEGFNLNIPLGDGTDMQQWTQALQIAASAIKEYSPDMLIVPLGVDTFALDPISTFKLTTQDYLTMGSLIADLNLPCVFLMEGGYDVGPIGQNVYNVLRGFEGDDDAYTDKPGPL
ncbi:acetylpolyamine amidohydrolase ['Osedax' symbiont bacterium Rs2_46_30_T18]|nr:acetylpolyamine amidohydrolase ['Osedax' symbiont bacterium Rs2_46_30_T18]